MKRLALDIVVVALSAAAFVLGVAFARWLLIAVLFVGLILVVVRARLRAART